MKFFENFDFKVLYLLKMSPIFVGPVHNFGKVHIFWEGHKNLAHLPLDIT